MSSTLPIDIDSKYLAPSFNYDFRNHEACVNYLKGKYDNHLDHATRNQLQLHHIPYGWYQHALNITGKYQDGDSWFNSSEWPIAYHGTKGDNIGSIVKEGFKPGGVGVFEYGVYTSPNLIHVEYTYAKEYKRSGKVYKIVLQVKVNPSSLIIHENVHGCKGIDYWVSTRHNPSQGIYDVRPYGILVKEI